MCGRSLWKQKCFRDGARITRKYQLGRDKLDMSTTTTWQSFIASLATVVTCSGTAVCNLICSPFVLENSRICSIWCTAYNNPVVQHHHSVFLNIDSNVRVPDFRFKFGCHLFYGWFFSYKCSWWHALFREQALAQTSCQQQSVAARG